MEIKRSGDESEGIRPSLGIACGFGFLGLGWVHWHVLSQGPDYSGFLSVVDHSFDFVLPALLIFLCAAVGKMVMTRCENIFDQALESLLIYFAVGAGIVAVAIMVLGLLRGFTPVLLAMLLAFFALVARHDVPKVVHLAARSLCEIKDHATAFDMIVFAAVVLFMISQALLPPLEWDCLMYHLEIPKEYLRMGRIFLPPDDLGTAFMQLAYMLYMPLLAFGSKAGPAVLSSLFCVGLGLTAFVTGRRFLSDLSASKGLSLLWGSPVLIAVGMTARIDVTAAFYLFLTQHVLLRVLLEEGAQPLFIIAAVLMGFAVSVKLTAAAYGLALCPLIWLAARKQNHGRLDCVKSVLLFGLVAFAVYLPWLFKNILITPFPFYPYSYPHPALVDPWIAGAYAAQHKLPPHGTFDLMVASKVPSNNPLYLFLNPRRLSFIGVNEWWVLNFLCLFLPLWFLFLNSTALNWMLIPAFIYLAMVMYVFHYPNMRYLSPMIAPMTMAAIHIMERFLSRFFQRRMLSRIFMAISVFVLIPAVCTMQRPFGDPTISSYLFGRISTHQFLLNSLQSPGEHAGEGHFMQMTDYINRHVPKNSRILMIFEGRSYYLEVPVIKDSRDYNWFQLYHLDSPADSLRAMGVTHVLISFDGLDFFANGMAMGLGSPYIREKELKAFAFAYLTPVSYGADCILYRLNR
jgi:hypothetical protein